jgi:hypothetical protein
MTGRRRCTQFPSLLQTKIKLSILIWIQFHTHEMEGCPSHVQFNVVNFVPKLLPFVTPHYTVKRSSHICFSFFQRASRAGVDPRRRFLKWNVLLIIWKLQIKYRYCKAYWIHIILIWLFVCEVHRKRSGPLSISFLLSLSDQNGKIAISRAWTQVLLLPILPL